MQTEGPPWLPDLLAIFGCQGGTIHQALARVREMKADLDHVRTVVRQAVRQLAQIAVSSVGACDKLEARAKAADDRYLRLAEHVATPCTGTDECCIHGTDAARADLADLLPGGLNVRAPGVVQS